MSRSVWISRALEATALISIPLSAFLFNRFQTTALYYSMGLCTLVAITLMIRLIWRTICRKRRFWEPLTFSVLFVVAFWAIGWAGRLGETWLFESIEQELLSCIEQNEHQLRDDEWTSLPVPSDLSHVVDMIWGQRYEDESLYMEFYTFGTFPVRHNGFLYFRGYSSAMHNDLMQRWSGQRSIRENWKSFSG